MVHRAAVLANSATTAGQEVGAAQAQLAAVQGDLTTRNSEVSAATLRVQVAVAEKDSVSQALAAKQAELDRVAGMLHLSPVAPSCVPLLCLCLTWLCRIPEGEG